MSTLQRATENKLEQRLSGAFIDLNELLEARFFARELELQQRRRALSLLAGPNKTNFRGRGIDFEEVRAYQPGDDIRTIDWRVTARSGKAYTKLFQEERERPLLIVTDQRQPMFFGSVHCFKSVTACYVSALLAWSGLNNGDRVGGLVFGNAGQREIRPRRSRQSALAFMHLLMEYNQSLSQSSAMQLPAAQHLEHSLMELRRIAKPGSAIYIVSDFAGYLESGNEQNGTTSTVAKHLYQLSRHCEITAIHISDPLEQMLPPAGQYTVSDGQQRNSIHTGDRELRRRYHQHFTEQRQQLSQQLGMLGIPLLEIGTNQAPLQRLMYYYGRRK